VIGIRQLGVDDVETYRALRLDALQSEPRAFGADHAHEATTSRDAFARRLTENAVFGAFDGLKAVGLAGFYKVTDIKSAHIGVLFGMYVAPSHRGRAIGRRLVETVIAHARGKVLQIELGVGTYNAPAIALYRACGFEIYGTEPRSLRVEGQFVDEHQMVRFLDREDQS
jgi:ribosomal protein S18 acetylase RimI-like enzyme